MIARLVNHIVEASHVEQNITGYTGDGIATGMCCIGVRYIITVLLPSLFELKSLLKQLQGSEQEAIMVPARNKL